jgi:Icc-related predicted phosphoesterase
MPRLAFIFRTDLHLSDRGPASWKGDYQAESWSIIQQVGDLARKYKCRAVLDGGDMFHVQSAVRNSHALVARTAVEHGKYPCETYSVPGNHDLKDNLLDSISRQPLGVLFATGTVKEMTNVVFEEGPLRVRVVGLPYSRARKLSDFHIRKEPGDTHLIVVAHALASKTASASSAEFFREPVWEYGSLVCENGPDAFMFGHWHTDQGIERIGSTYFVNQGAASRGSLSKENLERVPKVSLIEIDETGITAGDIKLKVAAGTEVFDVERKLRVDRESEVINKFVEDLALDAVAPTDSVESTVQKLDFASDVRDLALEYLNRARSGK